MNLSEIANLLRETMGLDSASVGSSLIERAVQARVAACELKDLQAYWEHVRTSEAELQELVEAVVVPETWFFRDREALAAMTRVAHGEWLPKHPTSMLRLLSLPCATGEEPYSIAMALLDTDFPANCFRIDAIDISAHAIARARTAIYGKNSFRGKDLGFRDRHFPLSKNGYHLADDVRRQVHFQQGNLFDPDFLPGAERYDVIFCRNVLIYFDRPTQGRAIKVLTRLLTADGILFVGPSETSLLIDHDFISSKIPLAFAFRKKGAAAPKLAQPGTAPIADISTPRQMPTLPRRASPESPVKRHSPPSPAPPVIAVAESRSNIDQARLLADQGHLAEAAQYCEEHLRSQGPSAEAYYLLGLVRDTAGNHTEAIDLYRKAIYLDAKHRDALLHLALLLNKRGDRSGAKVLNERAGRLESGSRH